MAAILEEAGALLGVVHKKMPEPYGSGIILLFS